jgi:hypothetical protein
VFQQNPQLATFLFQRKALEQSLKERTTFILDQQTPPFQLLSQPTAVNPTPPAVQSAKATGDK